MNEKAPTSADFLNCLGVVIGFVAVAFLLFTMADGHQDHEKRIRALEQAIAPVRS